MKTVFNLLVAVTCSLGVVLSASAQGHLIPDGIRSVTNSGNRVSIQVMQNPDYTAFTGFTFDPQPLGSATETFLFNPFLDGGVRAYFVSAGNPVTEAAILSGAYSQLLYPNTYVFADGIPFYLGLYVGADFSPPGPYENPLFGWAHLVNNGGIIELLGGALAYNAAGIYAGTQTIIQPVPEPSALCLVGLGLLGLGLSRWKRRIE